MWLVEEYNGQKLGKRGYIKIYVNRLNFILSVLPKGFKCFAFISSNGISSMSLMEWSGREKWSETAVDKSDLGSWLLLLSIGALTEVTFSFTNVLHVTFIALGHVNRLEDEQEMWRRMRRGLFERRRCKTWFLL